MNILNKFINLIDYIIYNFSIPVYYILLILIYFIYIANFFDFFYINPDYVIYLNGIIQLFIAIILGIRFNPYRKKITCTKTDRNIIWISFFFLFTYDILIMNRKNNFKR
jgi:hypothetical protein